MKKFIVTILALVYLSASVGATVHLHFCMGKLADWGLWHNDNEKCSECGMDKGKETGNDCCKDEHRQLKISDNHKAAAAYVLLELFSPTITSSFVELPQISFTSITEEKPLSHGPPRWRDLPVYLRNCVFRI